MTQPEKNFVFAALVGTPHNGHSLCLSYFKLEFSTLAGKDPMHLILNIQPLGRLEAPDLPVGRMDNSLRQCHLQVRLCSPCLLGLPPLSFSSIQRPRVRPSIRPSIQPRDRHLRLVTDGYSAARVRHSSRSVLQGRGREGSQVCSFPPIKVEFFLLSQY